MQKFTHSTIALSLNKNKHMNNSIFVSSLDQQQILSRKAKKILSKHSSSLDLNQRIKETQKIYRNISEKRKNHSKSIERSHSPKYDPSSKYRNSGFFIPSKLVPKPQAKNQNNKSKDKKLVLTTNSKNWLGKTENILNEELRKIKFGIKIFLQKVPEMLKIKNEKLFLQNYEAIITRFHRLYSNSQLQIPSEKQNSQKSLLNEFLECIMKCQNKKNDFKLRIMYESINKMQTEKTNISIKNKELLMKKQLQLKEINELHDKVYRLSEELSKFRSRERDKIHACVQTQIIENGSLDANQQSSSMIHLIKELREKKSKQDQYVEVLGILQASGVKIQSIVKKYSKKNKNISNPLTCLKLHPEKNGTKCNKSEKRPISQSDYSEIFQSSNSQMPLHKQQNAQNHFEQQQSLADESIISSMDALSFNFRDKKIEPQVFTPKIHVECQKQMDSELREELQLNFSCLYTDYEEQLDEDEIIGNNMEDDCKKINMKDGGCPTI